MENIKKKIDERLWDYIKKDYTSESYSNAILSSIQFIGDLIREKSGLQTDGLNLIGQSFGGRNPLIKINKLETESDRNIQIGIESILRGIYSAFRNPRSHSKSEDSEDDADAFILFINHILRIIDNSKGTFSIELFIQRINDNDFVNHKVYLDMLIKSIPPKKYFDLAFEIFRTKVNVNISNLKLFSPFLLSKLNEEQLKELLKASSDELRYTNSNDLIIFNISMFRNYWSLIEEDSKMRAENRLINCLKEAEIPDDHNHFGYYCNWINEIINSISLRTDFENELYRKLSDGNKSEQELVLNFFGYYFHRLRESPFYKLSEIFNEHIKKGNIMFYNFAKYHFEEGKIYLEIKESMDNFIDSDDVPF